MKLALKISLIAIMLNTLSVSAQIPEKELVKGYVYRPNDTKDPIAAGALEFLIPGLGYAYTGNYKMALNSFGGQVALGIVQVLVVNYQIRTGPHFTKFQAYFPIVAVGSIMAYHSIHHIIGAVRSAKIRNLEDREIASQFLIGPAVFNSGGGIGMVFRF